MKNWIVVIASFFIINGLLTGIAISPNNAWWDPILIGNLILVSICSLSWFCIALAALMESSL